MRIKFHNGTFSFKMHNMKKYILSMLVILAFTAVSFGQQRPQYTQYMVNPFLLNPAVSGTEDYVDIRAGYRKQWTGLEGSPRTMFLSSHTDIGKRWVTDRRIRKKKNGFHGVGAVVVNDVIGPTSTTIFNLAYSYHLRISNDWFASLGIMGGIQQYTMDGGKLHTANPGDQLITSFTRASLADINTGFWIHNNNFYAGASLIQVMPQKLYNDVSQSITDGKLAQHFFITAGYNIPMGEDFSFIPSFMIKSVYPAPISYDINAKVRYLDIAWAGISYRNTDSFAGMVGIIINNTFDISYSYDYITSDIRLASGGSHEVVVGYRLRKRTQLVCPSHFW